MTRLSYALAAAVVSTGIFALAPHHGISATASAGSATVATASGSLPGVAAESVLFTPATAPAQSAGLTSLDPTATLRPSRTALAALRAGSAIKTPGRLQSALIVAK